MENNPSTGGGNGGPFSDTGGLTDQYEDLGQMASARLGEAVDAFIEFVTEYPLVAAALFAGGVGAVIGLLIANRPRSRSERVRDAVSEQVDSVKHQAERLGTGGKKLGRAAELGELIPLAMKLFENPIVRGFLVQTLTRNIRKRFG